jgi:hypothetical protein
MTWLRAGSIQELLSSLVTALQLPECDGYKLVSSSGATVTSLDSLPDKCKLQVCRDQN